MTYLALLLAVISGVALVITVKPQKKNIQLLLAFSGAYLLAITVLHLIPDVFETQTHQIGLFILIGILLQTILEFFSKGAEHGHVHIHSELTKIPWVIFISLFIHAFIEGIPLYDSANQTLLWGIVIHKVPVAIVLTAFLIQTRLPKISIFCVLGAFAFMSPLGALAPQFLPFFGTYKTEITAVIIGVFLHIATAILFESSQNHQFNIKKFVAVLIGFGVAFLATQLAH